MRLVELMISKPPDEKVLIEHPLLLLMLVVVYMLRQYHVVFSFVFNSLLISN